jgi:hypothetical protein
MGLDLATGFLFTGWRESRLFWWLGIITKMQSADSGNQFNFCCSVTGRGRGRKGKTILKTNVQLRKQSTPSKDLLKLHFFFFKYERIGSGCG